MSKNEFGRSMVEMLGVLSIIAVLTISGVYGYSLAVRKHKTNEIIQVISMLYTLAHSANSGIGDCIELSKTSLPKNPGGVNINAVADATIEGGKTIINIQITSSESEKICNQIQHSIPENAEYEIDKCGQPSVSCNSGTD